MNTLTTLANLPQWAYAATLLTVAATMTTTTLALAIPLRLYHHGAHWDTKTQDTCASIITAATALTATALTTLTITTTL
ncbi:hypothetical protein [Actinomyces timonensis]|uniref:hypothetical protein n=1 Tax=Actinomyces timonensis TaxID=1288391 RepID=UPI000305969B|nr:hypothetical protein [Actinomyces timonensis]